MMRAALLTACFSLLIGGCKDSSTASRQNAGNNAAQIGVVHGDVTVNQRLEDEPVDIKGRWDDKAAHEIVSRSMQDAIKNNPMIFCRDQAGCEVKHHVIGEYHLIQEHKEVNLILIDSIPAGDECDACMPYISLFEFEKKKGGWSLVQSDPAAFAWGSWGTMDAAHVRAQVIGSNQYGIFFELDYGMGGEIELVTAVWTKLADSYVKVLHIYSGADDREASPSFAGSSVWHSKMRIEQGAPGMFDIIVDAAGKADGVRIDESTKFVFDGVEYRAAEVPSYLGPLDCIRKDFSGNCPVSER